MPFRTTVPSNVHSPNANVHDPKIPNNLAKAREPIRQRKHCKTVTPKTMKLGNTTIKNPPKLKTTHFASANIFSDTWEIPYVLLSAIWHETCPHLLDLSTLRGSSAAHSWLPHKRPFSCSGNHFLFSVTAILILHM